MFDGVSGVSAGLLLRNDTISNALRSFASSFES